MLKDILYRRSLDGMLLQCIDNHEIHEAMNEVQSGVCGAYQSRLKLYIAKEVGILLSYHDPRLHRLWKKVSSVPILHEVHKTIT